MNMLYRVICVAALIGLAGCGGPATPPADDSPAAPGDDASAPAQDAPPQPAQVSMTGSMTLRLFEPDMEGGESRKASFEISSPRCSLLGDGRWALTPATAIVYGKSGEQTTFQAGSAEFNENQDTASLRDGVTVDFGQQHVELKDMEWSNAEGVARSENPLSLADGETKLSGQAMEYHAETKTLLLQGVTGTVSLQPEGASS